MTRPRGSGFLASFSGTVASEELFALCAALPRSQSPAVFDELGYPPLSSFGQGLAPPVVILSAPRWPVPRERDEPVVAEAAIAALTRLLADDAFVVTPDLATRFDVLRQALGRRSLVLARANENRPEDNGDTHHGL